MDILILSWLLASFGVCPFSQHLPETRNWWSAHLLSLPALLLLASSKIFKTSRPRDYNRCVVTFCSPLRHLNKCRIGWIGAELHTLGLLMNPCSISSPWCLLNLLRLCVERPVALTVPVPSLPDTNLEAVNHSEPLLSAAQCIKQVFCWLFTSSNVYLHISSHWRCCTDMMDAFQGILQVSICDLGLQLWTSWTCPACSCFWHGQRAEPLADPCRGWTSLSDEF